MTVHIDGKTYLNVREAAIAAGRTVAAVGRWCRDKRFEARKDGAGRWLIEKISFENFLAGNTKESGE